VAKDKIMTREDLIIEMMPFSDELKQWCNNHSEFADALKIIYPERFITLQAIAISYSPYKPKDQVLGIFAYDYKENQNKFKQDFIINVNGQSEEFVLYTRLPNRAYSKYVKDIKEFYSTYAKSTHYENTHHPKLKELPVEIQERGQRAINLANKLKRTGLRKLSDEELQDLAMKTKTENRKQSNEK
jgi:hypothetical protein